MAPQILKTAEKLLKKTMETMKNLRSFGKNTCNKTQGCGMIFQHSARCVDFLSVPARVGRGDETAGGQN